MAVTRLESVWIGRDNDLLEAMFEFYMPDAKNVIDVCCNARRMWKGSKWFDKVIGYDIDPSVEPDVVTSWDNLPDDDRTVDVLVYDPPHLPLAAASKQSLGQYKRDYGLERSCSGDNIASLHSPFLLEAKRILVPDGLVFAKIKDYVHNHRYQWNLEIFNSEVRTAGMTPCDLIIKRDPCGGNLKSGKWAKAYHARNVHCYWVVVRNSNGCEAKSRHVRCGTLKPSPSQENHDAPDPRTESRPGRAPAAGPR